MCSPARLEVAAAGRKKEAKLAVLGPVYPD
jgi:hypothetical protein